jgi:alkylhydroperoxidase family enzyme
MIAIRFTIASSVLALGGPLLAGDGPDPPPVAVARPELKVVLEGSKQGKPRLPLPPLTEEEEARAERAAKDPGGNPMGGVVNNGRMRNFYLAPEFRGEFYVRPADAANPDARAILRWGAGDPAMPLDPTFRIMFFWLVARANNCYYCLGHQEVKLKAVGVTDDELAALDSDWSAFPPERAAAFAFVSKLAKTPQDVVAADVDGLRRHFDEAAILDIIFSTGGYCAMTRWTGGLAIPQEGHRDYLTPTSAAFRDRPSLVAPLDSAREAGEPRCRPVASNRPAPEPREVVEANLAAARARAAAGARERGTGRGAPAPRPGGSASQLGAPAGELPRRRQGPRAEHRRRRLARQGGARSDAPRPDRVDRGATGSRLVRGRPRASPAARSRPVR